MSVASSFPSLRLSFQVLLCHAPTTGSCTSVPLDYIRIIRGKKTQIEGPLETAKHTSTSGKREVRRLAPGSTRRRGSLSMILALAHVSGPVTQQHSNVSELDGVDLIQQATPTVREPMAPRNTLELPSRGSASVLSLPCREPSDTDQTVPCLQGRQLCFRKPSV